MKMWISFAAALLVNTAFTSAQTNQAVTNLLAPVKYSTDWKPHPEWYRSVLYERPAASMLTFGRYEYTLRGPLVETVRPSRSRTATTEDSLEGKLRRIPIVSLLVPYRMPMPPKEKTRYFRWKEESSRPWAAIEPVGANGVGGTDNRIHRRPVGTLISVDL